MCAYRKHTSDLTLNDLEPRYRGVDFPTFTVSPFTADLAKIKVCCTDMGRKQTL